MLEREEYVEQCYFFRVLRERLRQGIPMQDTLATLREEILSTTDLPKAIDFMDGELRHAGVFGTAMAKLAHYFTPFQSFVVGEAEREEGRFDLVVALEILEREANYRSEGVTPQGLFLYEFETLCRNRLGYDRGFAAIAADSLFDDAWREWILTVRRQVGIVDFADLLYVRSKAYVRDRVVRGLSADPADKPVLFGEKEGKIAAANRRKNPLLLFSALHRQLGYPAVPRPQPPDESVRLLPLLARRVERLEARIKLVEEEQREGIDLRRYYERHGKPDAP